MAAAETELVSSSSQGEAESSPPPERLKNISGGGNAFSSLGRQSSIYSLTLDEFQHTLCEGGKNFGSMNMDEFLTSIWTADESHHHHNHNHNHNHAPPPPHHNHSHNQNHKDLFLSPLPPPPQSLSRQASLTLPAPLCRKTVDEVWSEIHRKADMDHHHVPPEISRNVAEAGAAPRQPTFGEMTLEDFLVKAGVVREQQVAASSAAATAIAPPPPPPAITAQAPASVAVVQQQYIPAYSGFGVRNGGSPGSSDGMGVENSGFEMMRGGRNKRGLDGPVERVVERRQRRMIKNRESAARSRARKQAYTVELEAELNQLREENTNLKQALAELERKQKQQYLEEMKLKVQTKAYRAKEKLRVFRRNLSGPL